MQYGGSTMQCGGSTMQYGGLTMHSVLYLDMHCTALHYCVFSVEHAPCGNVNIFGAG